MRIVAHGRVHSITGVLERVGWNEFFFLLLVLTLTLHATNVTEEARTKESARRNRRKVRDVDRARRCNFFRKIHSPFSTTNRIEVRDSNDDLALTVNNITIHRIY